MNDWGGIKTIACLQGKAMVKTLREFFFFFFDNLSLGFFLQKLNFWVLSQFGFLSLIKIRFFILVTIWVLSQLVFLSFVTIWVFEYCQNLSFQVWPPFKRVFFFYYLSFWFFSSSQFAFLGFVTIWVFSFVKIWFFF